MSAGIYIHLPFCATHCAYCPFAISTNLSLQDQYIAALLAEIDARFRGGAVDTLYFGGGTPSRTAIEHLARIAARVNRRVVEGPGRAGARRSPSTPPGPSTTLGMTLEFTLEANPEDVTAESIEAWKQIGINRLSIGVQSFDDAELRAIGRIHDASQARAAIALAVQSGMRTNLDLILGLPQQSADSFRNSLDEAIALGVGHLSLYMLDLDEKTPLQVQVARGRTLLPEEDEVAKLYLEAVDRLGRAGLAQYEISNFAREGEESRHNLRYWQREPYLGFGLGAHSFVDERRFANTRDIHRYIADPLNAVDFSETLGDDERRHEFLFLRLRQTRGIIYEDLVELCGQEAVEWTERGLREGWLRRADSRVGFTPAGFLLSNDYISQLF